MSNSPLIDVVIKSPNYSSRNGNKISVITIHHTAGRCTATQIGNIFAKKSRNASCNYGIGYDGKIVLVVDEMYRSWCSSSRQNDEKAITIEVSNSTGAPNWEVSDASMKSLIRLVTDICQRNGITQLKFLNDKSKRFDTEAQNMTLHCWFASTACPGPYLKGKMTYIMNQVNGQLGTSVVPIPEPLPQKTETYTVKKGDTFGGIAARYGMSVSALKKLNPQIKNVNYIYPGQIIYVSGAASKDEPKDIPVYYTVRSGDSLSIIAQKYGTTVENIMRLNPSIKNKNLIYKNQRIRVK